jgi:hypothetical protein
MAAIAAKTFCWENCDKKYTIYIVVHFVAYLYILYGSCNILKYKWQILKTKSSYLLNDILLRQIPFF